LEKERRKKDGDLSGSFDDDAFVFGRKKEPKRVRKGSGMDRKRFLENQ